MSGIRSGATRRSAAAPAVAVLPSALLPAPADGAATSPQTIRH
ncbi:hypothetical protein [Streptomyces sp. CBMA123]|nr:hypothetical protein [Streptomyces sp. CBMA123]